MIIGFTGLNGTGKTTTANAMKKHGWEVQREFISDFIPPGMRVVGHTYSDPTPFINALEKLKRIHQLNELETYTNVIMDRTIYDSYLLAFVLLDEDAFAEYYKTHRKIEKRIKYDYLFFFEPIPKMDWLDYEIMMERLFELKVKPKCHFTVKYDTVDNRIQYIIKQLLTGDK